MEERKLPPPLVPVLSILDPSIVRAAAAACLLAGWSEPCSSAQPRGLRLQLSPRAGQVVFPPPLSWPCPSSPPGGTSSAVSPPAPPWSPSSVPCWCWNDAAGLRTHHLNLLSTFWQPRSRGGTIRRRGTDYYVPTRSMSQSPPYQHINCAGMTVAAD